MYSKHDKDQGCNVKYRRINAAGQIVFATCIWLATVICGLAAEENSGQMKFGPDPQRFQRSVDRGIEYLRSRGQAEDGSFGGRASVGITALVTTAVLRNGRTPQDPLAAKSLKYLEKFVQKNGGIHEPDSFISNYETCVALLCFKEANRDGGYDNTIKRSESFIRGNQIDETKGKDKSDLSYGGEGYGGSSRPDLSNTTYMIDALKSCGAKDDDPALQKALVFVSRCQNLESPHNTTQFAAKLNDGGFYYTCVPGRQSEDRQTSEGGLRSYGSMTYSGLKSMIYAGLDKDDPRVKAVLQWIRKNYDLKTNPGMGDAGLYYYYHTFARALDAMGLDQFEDTNGVKHDWRRELFEELAGRQQENGSWVNTNRQWMESDPNLATGFALLALSYCRPKN